MEVIDSKEKENAANTIIRFLNAANSVKDKEIGLHQTSHFDYIGKKQDETGDYYNIQYGWPQSGCVSVSFAITNDKDVLEQSLLSWPANEHGYAPAIVSCSINTQPKGEQIMMANFAPKNEIMPGLSINVDFGIDTGTEEFTTLEEIGNNPNAIRLLEIATGDLKTAEVYGDFDYRTVFCSDGSVQFCQASKAAPKGINRGK